MSGNSATGSTVIEMSPARVIKIDMTKANFGRLMKNWDSIADQLSVSDDEVC